MKMSTEIIIIAKLYFLIRKVDIADVDVVEMEI